MFQKRKQYRKNFISSGQLYMGGETLEFVTHDVSVTGVSIEVMPGQMLSEYADFDAYIKENALAEIFIKDLMLSGTVEIVWLHHDGDKIRMGLVFRDVLYNVERLWFKRHFYRKQLTFNGHLLINGKKVEFEGKNISVDGLMIYVHDLDEGLIPDSIVRLNSSYLDIKATAKVCWVKENVDAKGFFLGLKYLTKH